MALASIATDTRASIRVPASLCGVVGFKPTFGRIPANGIVWLSWTMDHIGVLAVSVGDAARTVDQLVPAPTNGHLEAPERGSVAGLRVAVPSAAFDGADPGVAVAVRRSLSLLEQ